VKAAAEEALGIAFQGQAKRAAILPLALHRDSVSACQGTVWCFRQLQGG
jgi:hypothetical protein